MDYTLKIGGEAGQGLVTVGELLSGAFALAGYHVFTSQDYESRIRGGHNFYQIRLADRPVASSADDVDIVVAMDKTSIEAHAHELTAHGMVVYDSASLKVKREGPEFLDVPFREIAISETNSPLMANTVASGAVLGMLGVDITHMKNLIARRFKKKGQEVVRHNIKAAESGYAYAMTECTQCRFDPAEPPEGGKAKVLLNSSEAVAMGALASGLRFYSAYPMTPSTGVMNNIAARAEKYGVVVEQAEDEIAAINLALGASYAGARAMTGTSGGGFALMVEGLSLAGITETPIVIAESQRPGPATGLPTRTEQGDLLFVIHTGHGEFPRVVLAPGSPQEALLLTNRAFELSEKYQVPAFVLMDQYLADSQWSYEGLDTDGLVYNDYRLRGTEFASLNTYARYTYTPSGISPMAVPGDGPHVVVADSDEHDEQGHLVEDIETRNAMVKKRWFNKIEALRAEMREPLVMGSDKPEVVLVGWGSTYGVLKEAVEALNAQGTPACHVHFTEIYPFPAPSGKYMDVLRGARLTVCVEGNATGQFARLVRAESGYEFDMFVLRYDGRPFSVQYVLKALAKKGDE